MTGERKLRIGVAGLGRAFTVMLPTFVADPRVALVAAADPRAEARARFAADFSAQTYETVEALCADPAVEIVYVATPHQHHAQHAILAAQHGKHVLVEKPMALTLEECAAMIAAAQAAGVHLIVGHSHSFDAPILRTRALIAGGEFGAVRMINTLNYTDFVYRPRRPGGTRHRAGRRRDLQPGGASGRHRAPARRRRGAKRARRDRRLGRGASDRRRLLGAAHVPRRRVRVAHLWGLRALRLG